MITTIRTATAADIDGLTRVHRDCRDPWQTREECEDWVLHRLSRGFLIRVALADCRVVGHAEWIRSDEPAGTLLHLGLLQIDAEWQRRGIGRQMIEDGVRLAVAEGCAFLATSPEDDGAAAFYAKQGFARRRTFYRCELPVPAGPAVRPGLSIVDDVPLAVVNELPFRLGWVQASSRHMWEVCNRPPATDDRRTPACINSQGAYLQLSYFEPNQTALVLCWSACPVDQELIQQALAFGATQGLTALTFVFPEEAKPQFEKVAGAKVSVDSVELVRLVTR